MAQRVSAAAQIGKAGFPPMTNGWPAHVERWLRIRSRKWFAYFAQSLSRISPALTPSTPAIATPGSAPCRTRAFEQLIRPGGAVSIKHPHPNYLDEFFLFEL
jgi:hypothetical protein